MMMPEKQGMTRKIFSGLLYCLKGYILFLFFLVLLQRGMIYHPSGAWIAPPGDFGAKAVTYAAADGQKLTSWYAPPTDGKPVIVMFHGNAGNLSHRASRLQYFAKSGYGMMLVGYRGYSGNSGRAGESGFYRDARAAITWLQKEEGLKENDIVLLGESIGSGSASQMAVEYKNVRALILEAPLTSLPAVAVEKFPWAWPASFLILDVYDNISKAPYFTAPLLVIHGTDDEVIGVQHGRDLYAAAGSPNKELKIIEGARHNDLPASGSLDLAVEFLNALK